MDAYPNKVAASSALRPVSSLPAIFIAESELQRIHYSAITQVDNELPPTLLAAGNAGSIVFQQNNHWLKAQVPTAANLNDVIYAKNYYISVGNKSTILISTDLLHWRQVNAAGLAQDIQDIEYGDVSNGVFIASSGSNKLLYSSDGINWSSVVFDSSYKFDFIKFFNKRFFAFDRNGGVWNSVDGHAWLQFFPEGLLGSHMDKQLKIIGLAYGDGLFLTISNNHKLITTSNGKNVSINAIPSQSLWNGIRFVNKRFIILDDAGGLVSSDDGKTWQAFLASKQPIYDLIYSPQIDSYVMALESGILIQKAKD